MRALHWDGSELRLADVPKPDAQAGMALVRVHLAGVCNTDLELTKGYMKFRGVLGHEFVGTVAEGPDAWRGRRVVGEINFACGQCATCRSGLPRHCPTRRVMGILDADGAFADYVAVPVANLHAVPDGIADDAAVFTEPLAAACEIAEQVRIEPGMRAIVLGDGKLGLLAAQILHLAGARVLAVGRHDEKLAHLRRRGIDDRAPRRVESGARRPRRRGDRRRGWFCARGRRHTAARHARAQEHHRRKRSAQSRAAGDR